LEVEEEAEVWFVIVVVEEEEEVGMKGEEATWSLY
jgi:hypothetical protein